MGYAALIQATEDTQPGDEQVWPSITVLIVSDIASTRYHDDVTRALHVGDCRRVVTADDGALDGPNCHADPKIVERIQECHPRAEWHITKAKFPSLEGVPTPIFVATVGANVVAMVAPHHDGPLGRKARLC